MTICVITGVLLYMGVNDVILTKCIYIIIYGMWYILYCSALIYRVFYTCMIVFPAWQNMDSPEPMTGSQPDGSSVINSWVSGAGNGVNTKYEIQLEKQEEVATSTGDDNNNEPD